MQGVINTIENQLTSANQKKPDPSVVKAWLRDLQHRLGAISPDRLERAFVLARDEASLRRGRGSFGQLSLDDVIRHYKTIPASVEEVPDDPHCPHACTKGEAMMIDRKGYEVVVPCSCRAGEHLRIRLKIYEGRRNVDELLRAGWKLKPRAQRISEDELQWLMARSFETSIMHAMWERKEGREMEAKDESMYRAAIVLSRSIGRS